MAFPYKRTLFDPQSKDPYKLSRSKIELFIQCPHCFYLDRRLGVSQPAGFPFNLNSAVDHLLKKEFDYYRALGQRHPLMEQNDIDALPFAHEELDTWRENFKGVQHHHVTTNFILTGAVDDLWIVPSGELIVVDYKATSKNSQVGIDAEWQGGYKRQMEFYQWLLRQNGFAVSPTGYFVYCNGRRDRDGFNAKLDFDISVIPYTGSDAWVEPTLQRIRSALLSAKPPTPSAQCDYCSYRKNAHTALGGSV
ncbi:MAG: PD-(D/E)XK nuclease family protein [Patescibacteria group bacterium]